MDQIYVFQISPLDLFVNSLIPLTFCLPLLLLTERQKEECSDFIKNSRAKQKKIRVLNFKKKNAFILQPDNQDSYKENLTTWKLGPIPYLPGPQLAIRKLKVSFVTHFYKFPQINCPSSTHTIFSFSFFFFPYESFSVSVCFQNKKLFPSVVNRYTLLGIADGIQSA